MRKSFTIAILIFSSSLSIGQESFTKGFDPSYSIKELAMDSWTNRSGLISNNVINVFQSSDDFLWIMSYNGLHRFDGHEFKFYDKSNIDFLISNGVNMAAEAENGNIIFCTQSDGLFQFDGLRFSPMSINDRIPTAIISIFFDRGGTLWVGTKNNGLYKMDTAGEVSKERQIPNLTVNDITEDLEGNIWVSTVGQGVYKIKPDGVENFSVKSGLAGDISTTLTIDDGNIVYVGSIDGLNAIEGKNVTSYPALKGTIINDIVIDDYGTKWLGSDRGVIRVPANGQQIEFFDESSGLPGNRVISLFFDNEGSLWAGTYETGLVRFKSSIISNLTSQQGLTTNRVYAVGINNGRYYVGAQDGNINVYDGKEISRIDLPEQFKEDAIRDFLFDNDTIWAVNYMGMVKIVSGQYTYFNQENISQSGIRRMFKSSDGTKWLATRSSGLVKFSEAGNPEVFNKNSGLLTNYVMAINEDKDGNILIGTNAGGFGILRRGGVLENYQISGDDSGTIIFSVRVEEDNTIWLCTNLGLFLFKDGTFRKIKFSDNLKTEKFFDLVFDRVDSYWLTSGYGVVKVKVNELDAFIRNEIDVVSSVIFNEEDGMGSRECTGATKSCFDQETGKIWVPTYEGVAIIDPSMEIVNNKIPKVLITGLQVDNNDIRSFNDNLIIQPGTFRYIFDFTSLSFLAPSKVQFKYKLHGIEEEWNGPTNKRRIEYTGLPYGDYELVVIASNNDNVWNTEGASLSFTVKPFFYETLWFRIAGLTVLLLFFYALYRWRVRSIKKTNRQLKKMNQELDSFIYSASHDLRGPLTTSMGVLDLAMSPKAEKEKLQYFEMIKSNTDKMDHFIKELINYARNKNDEVENEKIEMEAIINEVVDELRSDEAWKEIEINREIQGNLEIRGDERRLKVVIKNLLHNALVFSSQSAKPEIAISASQRNGKTVLVVKDNGVGISEDIQNKIFNMFFRGNNLSKGSGLGLYVVKNTCEKMNAKIDLQSTIGEGAEFTITLP